MCVAWKDAIKFSKHLSNTSFFGIRHQTHACKRMFTLRCKAGLTQVGNKRSLILSLWWNRNFFNGTDIEIWTIDKSMRVGKQGCCTWGRPYLLSIFPTYKDLAVLIGLSLVSSLLRKVCFAQVLQVFCRLLRPFYGYVMIRWEPLTKKECLQVLPCLTYFLVFSTLISQSKHTRLTNRLKPGISTSRLLCISHETNIPISW